MEKTGRGGGILKDAYLLMTLDDRIKQARKEGATGIIKQTDEAVPSVRGGGGKSATGFDTYMTMSAEQLAAKMNDMSENEYLEFINKAPDKLKKKYPHIDWD